MGPQFRSVILAGLSLVASQVPIPSAELIAAESSAGWQAGYEEAQETANRAGLPLLIHFHAWYCGPCRQMDSQVFSHPDVQRALQTGVIAVEVDVTKDPDLAARYNATTVPRDVVIYPGGLTETLNIGFVPRGSYLSMLSSIAQRGEKFRVTQPRQEITAAGEALPETARGAGDQAADADGVSSSESSGMVGLDGFCPVRLAQNREWVKGKPAISEEHRGVTYRFASEADRTAFRERPAHFAPQNLGCDPVLLYSSQKAISGRIEYGAFFDERLYLFSSMDNKNEFKKNPLKFTRIQHAIRVQDVRESRLQ